MSVPARLRQELAPVVTAAGADLEDVAVTRAGRRSVVRVVVDRDGGLTLDDVAAVSRGVSEALDELDAREPALLAGAYVLEVSTPGVDRPLTEARHWRRSTGRLVTATLREGGDVTGRLMAADDAGVVLESGGDRHELALADVASGRVQVEFDRRAVGPGDGEEDS